jgi:hypothetical protein
MGSEESSAMKLIKILFLLLFPLYATAGVATAGFRMVGETGGFSYSVIWDRWFEVPVWVYVESGELIFIGGGSTSQATAAIPKTIASRLMQLLREGLDEVDRARERNTVLKRELGSVKMLVDEQSNHQNGIDVYLDKDRTGLGTDVYLRVYDYSSPFKITDIALARNQVQDLIDILRSAPDTIGLLNKDERMMHNTNQLNLGKNRQEDNLDQVNEVRF